VRPEELTIVYRIHTFGAEFALRQIKVVLDEYRVPFTRFTSDEKPFPLSEAELLLKKAKTFDIAGQGFEFGLACIRNHSLDFLEIRRTTGRDIPWDEWAARFIQNKNFIMAWIADSEYDHWQNAKDLLEYTVVGRSHEHLPKKSNGLPYPLEQTIIDTSDNPGRRLFRMGYYEVVGATMWLGEPFWKLTGANRTSIETAEWLQISKLVPSVTRIQAAPKCFITANGKSGELQRKLRSLLFPETVGR
jgi:hypothetical protein